ncbi:hypothetical protein, partial [Mesorhizobium sp.]|uniref:hypothetical protein n=1 Tax=Mesorhizobium sp. TaxID=1871066 RepID=UPI0025DC0C6D
GFLPRGLSYACRRPKLFTLADSPVVAEEFGKAVIRLRSQVSSFSQFDGNAESSRCRTANAPSA